VDVNFRKGRTILTLLTFGCPNDQYIEIYKQSV